MSAERVLIVDDDPAILMLCQRILQANGYSVVGVKRAEDALSKVNSEQFDLVLTDIRLPGLTGLDLAQRLRARDPDLTVVTMTGYSNMEMAIQALSLGLDEFIVKPFTPEGLRVTLARALEKARLRRENLRLRALMPVVSAMRSLSATRTREQLYTLLLAAVARLIPSKDIALLAVDETKEQLRVAALQGEQLGPYLEQAFVIAELPDADWWRRGELQVWREREARRLPFQVAAETPLLGVPLDGHAERLGCVIALAADPQRGFGRGDAEAMGIIAAQAAAAMENIDLLAQVSLAYVKSRELERLKGEFINIAGHELRTPLALLLGYATLLRERITGELREYASEVLANAERLRRIAEDMLSLKYLETGKVDLRLEPCRVEEVVQQVVNAYTDMANERGQSIEIEITAQAGNVAADRAMLDLMLGNLISNACKFSPRQTVIQVHAHGDAQEVVLTVRDQGRGLAPGETEKIFDAFYQVGESLTRNVGGLGLGLTLTRQMAQAHGGRIWVESEHGRGSAFFIALPRQRMGQAHSAAHE